MFEKIVRNFFDEKESLEKSGFKTIIGNKRNIILYIFNILVSRVGLIAGVNPFGLAMFGAMENLEIPLLIPFVITAITTFISFGWLALLKFFIGAVIFTLIKSFVKFGDHKAGNTVKILFSATISELVGLAINGGLVFDSLLAVYSALTSAIFYLIFSEGIIPILNFGKKNVLSSETLIAAGIVLAVAISGIGNFSIFNISVRGIISVLIVLLIGWKRGPATGAATGIAISIVLGLIGIGNVTTIATYGFSGLLAGVFARFGKIGAVIGFALGNIILAFYASGSTEVIISIKEIVVASVVLFLIPKKATIILDDLFDYDKTLTEGQTDGYFPETTLYRLSAVSEVVDKIADNASNDEQEKLDSSDEIGCFIKTLNDNTCKRCDNCDKCWKQNYHSMYETIFNCIETLQANGEINENEIDSQLCQNKVLLADGLNFSYQIYKVNQSWQQKMREKRNQVSKQLKGVSKAINKIKEEVEQNKGETIILQGKYTLEIGMAKTKKKNSTISGDNTLMLRLKDGKFIIGISDGMGSGEEANENSKKALSILENLLNTGFDKKDAIDIVNSVVGYNKEDRYTTLDVSLFDTITGEAEFIKVSACPTYVKNKDGVNIVQSVSLPVGILENADIDLYDKDLEKDDLIIMITDGVLEANKEEKEKWILELLKSINPDNPQRLADIILQEAVDSNYGVVDDDMTVVVAKVKEAQ